MGFLSKANPVGDAARQRVEKVNRAFTGTNAIAANKAGLANTNLLLAELVEGQARTNELLEQLVAGLEAKQ